MEELDLSDNHFQRVGFEVLVASPYLTRLKRLLLDDSLIPDPVKQTLRERFGRKVHLEEVQRAPTKEL